jgi:hypothetical protein
MSQSRKVIRPALEPVPDFMRPHLAVPRTMLGVEYPEDGVSAAAIGFQFKMLGPGLVLADNLGLFVRDQNGAISASDSSTTSSRDLAAAARAARLMPIPSPRGLTEIADRHRMLGEAGQHMMLLMLERFSVLSLAPSEPWPLHHLAYRTRETSAVVITDIEGSSHERLQQIAKIAADIEVWREMTRGAYADLEDRHNLDFESIV